ncbi:zinc-binding dehydrogenase [Helcobacillus massiliensis]|uniref:NADPH:quinone reductase-like Zn-dependent oxidoreductase n=1 Tax=Helcobacillus massiliensis TaxID=521392 RepID=A0A839QZK4_9MICO|nr:MULTISPECIES: zinc-binding dehydrogenase [Helcobacillus]MBB3022827.1 NADPH:quinone reductase-like Zn-dependent oxidoreductase [Helcobacillus massiliensis]MCG7428106.1 zinc-binding dehydrogenase [Helcobacillus sp. ACRRO]MCT1558171.1 zinc-binding dehydrogenase [Helcobacillus massiliensis]MCT2036474.1 zinc-binding dehydrogenase [Helcobacillus massiliensis]MCT2332278.1 zinc-binding dehydrogenase [Helcobacillus massiliensis]
MRRAAARAGLGFEFFLMEPNGRELQELVALVDSGALTLPIDGRFPLDDYAAAFERLESRRSKGKVIVEIGA